MRKVHLGLATFIRHDNGDVEVLPEGPFTLTDEAWTHLVAEMYQAPASEAWMREALDPPLSQSEA